MTRAATSSQTHGWSLGAFPAHWVVPRRAWGDAPLWLLIGAFFFAACPFATQFFVHYPDERHYRDAALEMIASGDYLTPRTTEEPVRLRKPILTYWMIVASYHVLGVSPAASRLPFLLAACAVVWLTHRVARLLTDCQTTANLAALIVVCHPALWMSSCRSLPDIPLCLFLLLSAYGFLGLMVRDCAAPRWLCAAYIGGGLAVATKGLPAVAFVATAMSFIALHPRLHGAKQWKAHAPWMAAGVVIAGAWFAAMAVLHGEQLFAVFMNDQVHGRIAWKPWRPPLQFLLYALMLSANFVPWLLPLRHARRESLHRQFVADAGRRHGIQFMLLWCALFLVLASCVIGASLRYALPIVPLLAVLLAMAIKSIPDEQITQWARRITGVVLALLLACTSVAIVVAVYYEGLAVAVPLLCFACGAIVVVNKRGRTWSWPSSLQLAALGLLAMFPCVEIIGRPIAVPELGICIWQKIELLEVDPQRPIAVVDDWGLASRLRLYSEGAAQVSVCRGRDIKSLAKRCHTVVLVGNQLGAFDTRCFQLHQFTHGWEGIRIGDVLSACWQGELAAYEAAHRRTITIGLRRADLEHESLAETDDESVTPTRESVGDRRADTSVDRADRAASSRG